MKRSLLTAAVAACCAGTVYAGPTFTRRDGPAVKRPAPPAGGVQDAMPFSDNFDSYIAGSNVGGQGTWEKWEPASVEAVVSSAQASSPANSMRIDPQSDITQRGNVTAGVWELRCKTYYPSTNVGPGANDGGFVIGLNQFDPISPNTQPNSYWSAQIQWHPGTNRVRNYNAQATDFTAIVPNQWVDFRMVVNLGTDRWDAYYNGVQIVNQRVWSTNVAPGGAVAIACWDFYSGNLATTVPFQMFFDDISFSEVVSCYANCDGSTGNPALTANDFQCFIDKYAANEGYANCDGSTGTPALTANDFQCFINKYAAGCT